MPIVTIEGFNCTLFYDYDQLDNGILTSLSDDGKIDWLRKRMEYVFLNPLQTLMNPSSDAYKELNTPDSFCLIMAFSNLLNGIESLGGFIKPSEGNAIRFKAFIKDFLPTWNITISGCNVSDHLWKHFRNGIAHAFVIENGGLQYSTSTDTFVYNSPQLKVCPEKAIQDFLLAVSMFFTEVQKPTSTYRVNFLIRFNTAYPN